MSEMEKIEQVYKGVEVKDLPKQNDTLSMIAEQDLDDLYNDSYLKMRIQNMMDKADEAKDDQGRAQFVFE